MGGPLSRRTQWAIVAAAALASAVIYGAAGPLGGLFASAPAGAAAPPQPGTFTATKEEWAGLQTARVETRRFRPEHTTYGNVALDDDLSTPVFSPYSGRVVRVIAELGAHVERGQPLFAIDATELIQGANTLISAVAADKTARSQLDQAKINEKRAHDLYLAKGGALKDWQQSRTDRAAAENTLRSADIALAAARNQLRILGESDAQIAALEAQPTQRLDPVAIVRAPIAGTVTQRQISLGQYIESVSAGGSNPVYTIGDLAKVYLIANVREADAGDVHMGDPVEVRVLAFPGRVFKARLSWVAPSIDPNTHALQVRADINNPDGALKPLMFAIFTIITGQPVAAPAIPADAIVYEGDQARVWVVGKNRTLGLREIRVGETSGGMIEVLSGLAAGERVVTKGAIFIDRAGGTS